MNCLRLVCSAFTLWIISLSAHATPIFSQTFSAQDIFNQATFSDRAATLSGNSVAFGASVSGSTNAGFLDLELIGAGVLSATGQYQVTLTVNEDRALGGIDQDVFYGIAEGGSGSRDFVAIQHADNGGGQLRQFAGSFDSIGAVDTLTGATGGAIQFPGAFETWSADILIGAVDSIAVTSPVTLAAFGSISFDIDPSLGVSFNGFLDNFYETTGLKSVSVSVTDLNAAPVPEPSSTILLALGMLGLFRVRSVGR